MCEDNTMTAWLISANPNMFNHDAAFRKCGYCDWIQFGNFEIGDTVYLYASKQCGYIKFKTVVIRNNMKFNQIDKDDSLWLDTHDLKRQEAKYSRLKLVKRIEDNKLTLNRLRLYGLKNAPQRSKKLDGELLKYIENNE